MARIILVGRDSVKPVFHFVINQLKRCGIFVVTLSGLPLFCAVRGGLGLCAVSRSQQILTLGASRSGLLTTCCGCFANTKKTGAGPVFVFLFAVGSEEGSLERVAGIEPA